MFSSLVSLFNSINLRIRVHLLIFHLKKNKIYCSINFHYRDKSEAHRWSTAYSIINGDINISKLRELKDGKDIDGNLWYKSEWDNNSTKDFSANLIQEIVDNAKRLGPSKIVYAEEGYSQFDTRRLPNSSGIPVSKHVTGEAIDINMNWSKFSDPWSEEANLLFSKFGLKRPFSDERWHVELA